MMKFLYNIAGIAGAEFAVLLAFVAVAFVLSGHGISLDPAEFAASNF